MSSERPEYFGKFHSQAVKSKYPELVRENVYLRGEHSPHHKDLPQPIISDCNWSNDMRPVSDSIENVIVILGQMTTGTHTVLEAILWYIFKV